MRVFSETSEIHSSRPRRGASTVEFAFTVPILFLLFFAAFDLCRYSMLLHATEQAAFEGARKGSIVSSDAADAEAAAQAELDKLQMTGAVITVEPADIDLSTKDVTVRVRVPINENSWGTARVLAGGYVDKSITMPREYVPGE